MILYYILGLIFACLFLGIIYFSTKSKQENFTQTTPTCYDSLIPCNNGQCINCSNDFECVTIDENSEKYMFNGGKVPNGSYCLPKKQNKETCNRYTGRWVWTADGTSQTWKCECLYPSLFGGDDCTVQKACNNGPNPDGQNKLIGTNVSGVNEGKAWDPISGDASILMINPYTTDASGKPYFSCSCGQTVPNFMKSLPSSPYTCHIDKCWSNHSIDSIDIIDGDKIQCKCTDISGGYEVPEGLNKGTCFKGDEVCGDGNTWDATNKVCICSKGGGICSQKCNNGFGVIGDNNSLGHQIFCEGNVAGRMCYNMCEHDNPCDPYGTDTCTPSCQEFTCQCKTGGDTNYSGRLCEDHCYNENHSFGESECVPSGTTGNYDCTCVKFEDHATECCSKSIVKPNMDHTGCYCSKQT